MAERWSAGRAPVRRDGLLAARLRAEADGRPRRVPGNAAAGRPAGGGGRRRGGGVVAPPPGRWCGPTGSPRYDHYQGKCYRIDPVPGNPEQFIAYIAYDLDLFEEGSIANLSSSHHRQRLRLQGAQGAAPGGHAHPAALREDLPGPRARHRDGARVPEQVRPPAARGHRQAQARAVREELRPRRLRGAARRPRLHQGRREHQQPAVHALARPVPALHGGGRARRRRRPARSRATTSTSPPRRWRTCTSGPTSPRRSAASS